MDEREIVQHMRQYVAQHSASAAAAPLPSTRASEPASSFELQKARASIEVIWAAHNAVGQLNPRRPGLRNNAIQLVKKVMQRMLSWYTRPLHAFQRAVATAMDDQVFAIETLHKHEKQLGVLQAELAQDVGKISRAQARLSQEQLRLVQAQKQLAQEQARLARIERFLAVPKIDYADFQTRYRGAESDIRARQREYLQYFTPEGRVVDLGCGRGEFLDALRDNGISCSGVDIDQNAVAACRAKDLDVTHGDLFEFLEALENNSLGGIFSAQVIEHLPVGLQMYLLDLCRAKLKLGAPIVVETLNPECLFALARDFFLDPTHVRPVPPELLKFALESKGFGRVELKFSSPVEGRYIEHLPLSHNSEEWQLLSKAVLDANRMLFGHQDYAAIAWKSSE